jgi:type VI secretion system secreted protein VgrG
MSLGDAFKLSITGCSSRLYVVRVEGVERVHAPFQFTVTVRVDDGVPVDAEVVLGEKASLTLAHESEPRVVRGVIDAMEEMATGYRFTLASRVTALGDTVDHRVFLDRDALEIAESVLREHGVTVKKRLVRALPKRAQCVQAFESDLAFVSRILAEEGILWHSEHDADEAVVLTDNAGAYAPIAGDETIAFAHDAGLVGAEAVFAAAHTRGAVHDKVTLGDYDFERPLVDQAVSAGSGPLERHEFPGGYADPSVGAALAKIRLEEAQARATVLRARTTSRRLSPGRTFKLAGAPREDLNGTWLVLELVHRGFDEGAESTDDGRRRYEAELVAVPTVIPHRPARVQAPTIGGVQTATTTGPGDAEIHTEKHGRVKALLRWDRLGKTDDTSSTWIRSLQPPTSGGLFLPRTGWEVLVGFSGASGDAPYQLGRMMNAEAPPSEGLPAKKVRSAFGTLTTPGGGSGNRLCLDDAAGNEGMNLNASRDYNERTENDKGTSVHGNDVHSVGANHTDIVGIAHALSVKGAHTYTIGGSRDVTTVGAFSIGTASESVSVGGLRSFQVGGDYETTAATLLRSVGAVKAEVAIQEVNRHVSGVSTVAVGGSWNETGGLTSSVSVLGASALTVGGPLSIKAKGYSLSASLLSETYAAKSVSAKGKRVEAFGGPAKYAIGGSMKMKGGAGVFFKAAAKITLKASGATITITPSAIKIRGTFDSSEASIVTGKDQNE